MRNALIIDSVRTAVGRMGGTLKDIEVDYLSCKSIRRNSRPYWN